MASAHAATAKALPFVSSLSLDECMCELVIDGQEFTIMLPDEYPRGEPALFGDITATLRAGTLPELCTQVHELIEADKKKAAAAKRPVLDDLHKDMESFNNRFGANAASERAFETSAWISIDIPCATLVDESMARAWGIKRQLPITVQFKFPTKAYTEQSRPPSIELTQAGEKFPLGQQLTRQLTMFLEANWHGKWTPPAKDIQLARSSFDADDSSANSSPAKKGDQFVDKFKGATEKKYDPLTDPEKYVRYNDEAGFLCYIADVIQKRIPTCHKYCVICDKPHVFAASSMLRASVCSRDVCVFAFQEFKVGGDAAESVATDGGVIDLLLNIFRGCVQSSRAETVLVPFPHVFDPKDPSKAVFDPKKPDFTKLREVTSHFPTVKDLVGADDLASLKINLNKKDPLAYPLLEWIINSNRSLIIKMDREHQIKEMKTPHQFLLMQAAPEKQKKFNEMKAKSGTVFAWHGSSIENWHAILRTGLRNASGTKLQVNGAVHGSGIYFAPQASSSLGYCRSTISGSSRNDKKDGLEDQFIDASGMICMALCEIIKGKPKDCGWCWTLEDEDAVVTRFFFAFDAHSGQEVGGDTKDSKFEAEIRATMKFYGIE